MKIAFMGTPDFAVPCLEALLGSQHTVCAVYTQPDQPKGRGYTMTPPPVKEYALKKGLPVFQPERIRDEEQIQQLAKLAPDCIVVVAYGKILPQAILDIPRYGCMNIHGSLLPKYRGAAPIQWAVLNGDTVTGVTSMQMDAGMDTGDILLTSEILIGEEETAGELFDRLKLLGGPLLLQTLDGLQQGTLQPRKQDSSQASEAPMLSKALSPMDWTRSAKELHNQVRGLNPWPGAHTLFRGKRLKVYATKVLPQTSTAASGTILKGRAMCVTCGDGTVLELSEVQPEGKRRMTGEEFLRGYPTQAGERLK